MAEAVSVIITCYNLQFYIREAVISVLSQDYEGDVQIIVVDDGSTDESRTIIAEFSSIDLVYQNENGGVMRATIAGLRAARHDVVFFLDGDDVWHPQKLSRCMECFDGEAKLCTHDLWHMGPDSRDLFRPSRVSEVMSSVCVSDQDALISRCILNHLDYVWLGSAFGVRRSIGGVDAFIDFCEARDYLRTCYQDWPLATWVALQRAGKMTYVDNKLFGYRLHDSNYSGSTQTIDKLRRNLGKSLDTARLIEELMAHNAAAPEHVWASRQVRMRYEILLASARNARLKLFRILLNNLGAIEPNHAGLKILVRVALTLILGAERAHGVVELGKRRLAAV